jgi:hypothetical protein
VPPSSIWQPAGVKIGINRHIVAKTLGCCEQDFQFDLLDGFLFCLAALSFTYRSENFIVAEWGYGVRGVMVE